MPDKIWAAYRAERDKAWTIAPDGSILTDDPWIAERARVLKETWSRG